MRWVPLIVAVAAVLAIAVVGHVQLKAQRPDRQTQAVAAQQPNEVVVAIGLPVQVKNFREDPDPAGDARTRASCLKAGGEWGPVYELGVLYLQVPEEGAVRRGMACWSKRKPTKFADAGKACQGQADCMGNCTLPRPTGGQPSTPKCQAVRQAEYCGWIYDKGRSFEVQCAIP